jgi:tetratricopeptide (TPR) repeat protein
MAMSLAAGFGIGWVVEKLGSWHRSPAAARVVSAAVTLPALLAALAANLPYNNRSRDFIAADYVQNIFSTMEPRAMLLTGDWQVYSPMLYIHQLLRQRDDAVVIDINQLRRSWYYGYLARAYPSTIARSREKVDAFLEDLRHWEHDPGLYERDSTLNRRIDSRFYGMILALVTSHFKSAAVYVTSDIAANRKGTDLKLTRSLASAYQFVPQGLIFQLAQKGVFQRPSDHELVTRGLTGGGMKFEEDDVVRVKVLPVYVMMAYSRGRYLAAYGRHEQAIEAFKRALALDPGFSLAQQAIDESLGAMRTATPNNQD